MRFTSPCTAASRSAGPAFHTSKSLTNCLPNYILLLELAADLCAREPYERMGTLCTNGR